MSSTIEELIGVYSPKLFNSDSLSVYIETSKLQTSECFFGNSYNLAVALRACHNFEINNRDENYNPAGNINSLKEGDLAKGFGSTNSSSNSGNLAQTGYGMQLQGLINSSSLSMGVTGVGGFGCAN